MLHVSHTLVRRLFGAVLFFGAAAVSASAQESQPTVYEFKRSPIPVGAVLTVDDITVAAPTFEAVSKKEKTALPATAATTTTIVRQEVLAIDGTRLKKVKVYFDRASTSVSRTGEPDRIEDSTLEKKTFIVEETKDGVDVYDDKNVLVDLDVAAKVKRAVDAGESGLGDVYSDELANEVFGKKLKIGDKVELPQPKFLKGLSSDARFQTAKLVLTLKATRKVGDVLCGVFDISGRIDAVLPEFDLTMNVPLEGDCVIGIDDSWLYQMKIQGPVQGGGTVKRSDFEATVTASGYMKFDLRHDLKIPVKK